jgi:hypothetical protein
MERKDPFRQSAVIAYYAILVYLDYGFNHFIAGYFFEMIL